MPRCRNGGGSIAGTDVLSKFGITDRPDLQVLYVEKHGLLWSTCVARTIQCVANSKAGDRAVSGAPQGRGGTYRWGIARRSPRFKRQTYTGRNSRPNQPLPLEGTNRRASGHFDGCAGCW